MNRKLIKAIAAQLQNVFCATGDGGGIDPTCKVDDLGKDEVTEAGKVFKTGQSVTFRSSRRVAETPKPGVHDTFQQRIEPAGRYMLHVPDADAKQQPGTEVEEVTFRNPLVLVRTTDEKGAGLYGVGSWKARLSRAYKGKKGKSLSRAVAADGYDGIVTTNPEFSETGEIVDLRMFHKGG